MAVEHIIPEAIGAPAGPYTHVVKTDDYVYLSGQAPIEPQTGKVISGSFYEEATLVFENIKTCLDSVGLTFSDVIKVNVYLGDLAYREEYNELYQKYFKKPFPARTTIACDLGTMKIEIDVIAYCRK